jgi:hypothetical protein
MNFLPYNKMPSSSTSYISSVSIAEQERRFRNQFKEGLKVMLSVEVVFVYIISV